jgi:hypothetical protein
MMGFAEGSRCRTIARSPAISAASPKAAATGSVDSRCEEAATMIVRAVGYRAAIWAYASVYCAGSSPRSARLELGVTTTSDAPDTLATVSLSKTRSSKRSTSRATSRAMKMPAAAATPT